MAAVCATRSIAVLIVGTASDTEAIDVGLNQLDVIWETGASRVIRLAISVIIILTTFVIGAQTIGSRVNGTCNLNESSGRVGLIIGGGNEAGRHGTGTRSIDVGDSAERNSIIFTVGNGFDILLVAVISFITSTGRQKQAEAGFAVQSNCHTRYVGGSGSNNSLSRCHSGCHLGGGSLSGNDSGDLGSRLDIANGVVRIQNTLFVEQVTAVNSRAVDVGRTLSVCRNNDLY
jgi:hypothetical protein